MSRTENHPYAESAARFQQELSALGLKRKDFAERTGMNANTVSRWSTGFQQPPAIVWAYLRLLSKVREIEK